MHCVICTQHLYCLHGLKYVATSCNNLHCFLYRTVTSSTAWHAAHCAAWLCDTQLLMHYKQNKNDRVSCHVVRIAALVFKLVCKSLSDQAPTCVSGMLLGGCLRRGVSGDTTSEASFLCVEARGRCGRTYITQKHPTDLVKPDLSGWVAHILPVTPVYPGYPLYCV